MKAHPSAFLTTRQAIPRIFPFPLGKTRSEAAVRDELWWEDGNAPHVVRLLSFISDCFIVDCIYADDISSGILGSL